jgi:serine/threonine-protein kinase ATR
MREGALVRALLLSAIALMCAPWSACAGAEAPPQRPMMKDFMGICGHFPFKGPTYAPVAGLVRNYHPLRWDLDVAKPYVDPPYPFALNRVNWEDLYGGWRRAGFTIDACIMWDDYKPQEWVTPEQSAHSYGKVFARFLGPSGKDLVTVAELGNEPGKYSDEQFTAVAHALALGLKEGDPRMRVATANLSLGKGDDYSKSIKCYEGWWDLVDILNVHSYAMMGAWPNERRTHPEDPACAYLTTVRDLLAWRDANAPGKPVWVTEFGWDAHRAEGAPLEVGVPIHDRPSTVSRVQQAQYLLRSYLIFARMGVDRACMFWFQDDGAQKGLFSACGIISKGVKQPAYYAMASLRRNLGDYGSCMALTEEPGGVYAYRFDSGKDRACVAAWSPTRDGEPRTCRIALDAAGLSGFAFVRAVEPAVSESGDRAVEVSVADGAAVLQATGMPRLVFFERKR